MAKKASVKKDIDFCKEGETSGRHVTKVLWSRDRNEFFADRELIQDIGESLSENEGTVSSCSWGFDEYEIKATKRIKASLDAIEEALYDGSKDPLLSPELYEECQKWSKRFPYLRLKGKEIVPTDYNTSELQTSTNERATSSQFYGHLSSTPDIIKLNSPEQTSPLSSHNSDIETTDVEEVIAQDGNYEKDHDVDQSRKSCDNEFDSDLSDNNSVRSSFSVDYMKEKVVEQLASHVWSEVLLKWGKPKDSESSNSESNDCLPPITAPQEQRSPLAFPRPWTRGKTPKTSDFPKLDGILTVSPKVLQKRSDSRIGSGANGRTRPNTGVSVLSYSSIESYHNSSLPKRVIKSREKSASSNKTSQPIRKRSPEKETDLLNLYLPVLEENSPLLHRRLQGDFDVKESFCRLKFPEASSFPIKPSFLPPIDDRDSNGVCSHRDLQRPISYESHLPSAKKHNHSNMYTRHLNKISARPSTTRTSWGLKNPKFDASRRKDLSPMETESMLSVKNKKMGTENVDNLVTLFPIVTSLEPKQLPDRSKNQKFSRKNSLLSAFDRNEKR